MYVVFMYLFFPFLLFSYIYLSLLSWYHLCLLWCLADYIVKLLNPRVDDNCYIFLGIFLAVLQVWVWIVLGYPLFTTTHVMIVHSFWDWGPIPRPEWALGSGGSMIPMLDAKSTWLLWWPHLEFTSSWHTTFVRLPIDEWLSLFLLYL